jgi:hypothetical protein
MQFVIPAIDGSTELPLDYEGPEPDRPFAGSEGEELDGLRMRQVITARRAAIRSRTYMLLGAMLCAVGVAKLITLMIPHIRHGGWSRLLIAYGIAAALAIIATLYCLQRAAELNRESKATALPEPTTPPDFSTLSDGSQHAKNLENIA